MGTAHALRAAAVRLARQRAVQEGDAAQAYGCVDWFRYEAATPRQEANPDPSCGEPLPAAADAAESPRH